MQLHFINYCYIGYEECYLFCNKLCQTDQIFFAAQGSHQFHNINVIIRLELTKITLLHHKLGKVRISFQYDSNKIFGQDESQDKWVYRRSVSVIELFPNNQRKGLILLINVQPISQASY